MTETEWLACTDPEPMLDYLEDKASARKFRLYHCAVLRQHLRWLGKIGRQAIEVTERYFDTANGSRRLAAKRLVNHTPGGEEVMGQCVEELGLQPLYYDPLECLPFFQCVFGNPFHPITISPFTLTWNDAVVVRLAQAAYEERHLPAGTLDNCRLAVLADALEEAGCTSEEILDHLRGPGPHVRGCWPIDLCLGKS